MNIDDLPLVVTVPEAAAALRISPWQVRQLAARGDLRTLRLGRCLRIPRAELERLLGAAGPPTGPACAATDNVPEPAADQTASSPWTG